MTLPSFLLGLLVSTLCGLLVHLIRSGGLDRLALYIVFGWIGFWGGHLLAAARGWTFLSIGPLNLGMALLSSFLLLGLVVAVTLVRIGPPDPDE